jgi:hypothetical protein
VESTTWRKTLQTKVLQDFAYSASVASNAPDYKPFLAKPPVNLFDGGEPVHYDGAIMMAKTQITLETEMQRRARQRANDLGVSLAEYFRRLVARDLARPETAAHVDRIFDLGSSGGSDIASQKDSMIAEAFHSTRRKPRRR